LAKKITVLKNADILGPIADFFFFLKQPYSKSVIWLRVSTYVIQKYFRKHDVSDEFHCFNFFSFYRISNVLTGKQLEILLNSHFYHLTLK